MPNYKKVAKVALEALEAIVKRHDRAAAQEEPGFTCGCRDCKDAITALEFADREGT
jgi:hypothetical protein